MARNKFDVDETLETPFSLKHFKRASVYLKDHKAAMVLTLVLAISSSLVSLTGPLILKDAMDNTIPSGNMIRLIWESVLYAATIVVSILLTVYRSRIMTKVAQKIIYDMRKDIFAHLQDLPFQYFDERPHGKILVRVVNYPNNVANMLTNGIINFIMDFINLVIIAIYMFCFINAKLALIVVAGLPIFAVILMIIKPVQRRSWQQVSNKNSNMTAYLHESIDGTNITQVFAREDENAQIFDRLSGNFRKAWLKAAMTSNLIWVTVENLTTWVVCGVYVVGVVFFHDTVSLGTFIAMGNYTTKFWQPISNLANIYNDFINTIAYLERIFELLDEPIVIGSKENAPALPPITGAVDFDNVTFSYDGRINVLENVSFHINPGESVALVGPTGAGKSTIVNLISRFYEVNGGAVRLDGYDVRDVDLHSMRAQMGIMLQDSFIFSGTIMDNVRYGRLDATDEEVKEACVQACADEFIRDFEQGYETEVNERGSRLSQGQKQLISFARTLIANPKILVLDEATSSIDAKTEVLVQKAMNNLLKGRTSFVIAHRLSTIRNCDKIMFISNKGITECGTHAELLEKRGDYYKLYTSQMVK